MKYFEVIFYFIWLKRKAIFGAVVQGRAGQPRTSLPAGGQGSGWCRRRGELQLRKKQLKIPTRTTQFKLITDIILVSEAKKQLLFQELTVPWEERMEKAQERRRESTRS